MEKRMMPDRSRPFRTMVPWIIFLSVSGAYVGLTLARFDIQGPILLSLAIAPITTAAWFWNLKGGLIAALFIGGLVNTGILYLQGIRGWDALLKIHGGFGLGILIMLGGLIGYFSSLRRRLIVELQKRTVTEKALEDRNSEILDFTYNVSHDLKNPLTAIRTLLTLLEKNPEGRPTAEFSEILRTGNESVAYMQELLEDLLTCAKLEYAGLSLDRETVRVDEIARQVLERFRFKIEARKIRVTIDAPVSVRVDRKYFTRIIMNLVDNAVKYIARGPDPAIRIRALLKKDHTEIAVEDTGIGVLPEDQDLLFKKFMRGANSKAVAGTGLGLTIAKSAVEAHGGRIWLESTPGLGTTVRFTVPISPDISIPPATKRSPSWKNAS